MRWAGRVEKCVYGKSKVYPAHSMKTWRGCKGRAPYIIKLRANL